MPSYPKLLVISNYRATTTARPEAEIFIDLARKGFDIHIMTFSDAEYCQRFAENGITLIDFHPLHKFKRKESQIIRKYIIDNKIDIIHLFNSEATYNGIRAARNLPVKVVLYRGYCGNIKWWSPKDYLKYLHPRVDATVCNSIGVYNMLKKNLIFNQSKVVCINKGHDLEWYKNIEAIDVRQSFSIPNDALVAITVANNRRMKGIPVLLRALSDLNNKQIYLLLVGNDMKIPKNESLINASIKDNIIFTGFRKDVLQLVKGSDVFVLPSLFGESITKSVLEAMSLGVPALISDISGNVELVKEDYNGKIFKKNNSEDLKRALQWSLDNKTKLKNMGENAQKHVKDNLSHDETSKKYGQFYLDLFNQKI